jgi:hypothetical protein
MSMEELIQKGVVTGFDNLEMFLPGIDSRAPEPNGQLLPSVQIDIAGAAESYHLRKMRRCAQIEKIKNLMSPPTPLDESALSEYLRVSTPQGEADADAEGEREAAAAGEGEGGEAADSPLVSGVRRPRVYEDLQDEYAYQTLLVVRGKIARETPDFESFQRTNVAIWPKFDAILAKIEEFCKMLGLQFAQINGRKLGAVAQMATVTYDDVRACLESVEDVIAATLDAKARLIQNNVRIFLHKVHVRSRKRLHRAAYTIQTWWRTLCRNASLVERDMERNEQFVVQAAAITEEFKESVVLADLQNDPVTVVHVVASAQDLARAFCLIHKHTTVILVLPELPPPHIWEDIMEFFAHCGIPDVNERIHFILLREMNSGDAISHRLECDMRSVKNIKRLIRGRGAFIIPHPDWFSEHRLSADLGIPILGLVDTTEFQSRGQIKAIFTEAEVVTPLSTGEFRDPIRLCRDVKELFRTNPDLLRCIIRYGFSQNDSSIAYFDRTPEFLADDSEPLLEMRKSLHVGTDTTRTEFFKMINMVGGIAEIVPTIVLCFPSVSLFLSGDKKIEVVGTFDRLHHAPYRFAGAVVPDACLDNQELLGHAKRVASVLLKRGIIGFVLIDFLLYKEKGSLMLMGFDIRINAYPSLLFSTYMTTCTGFKPDTGRMAVLSHIRDQVGNAARYAVILNSLAHPGMGYFSMKEVRKQCHGEGLFFDLLTRTGFKMLFFDAPAKGKNFALLSATSPELALHQMQNALSFLLRTFGPKAGGDGNCSLANAVQAIRKFRERVGLAG